MIKILGSVIIGAAFFVICCIAVNSGRISRAEEVKIEEYEEEL